MKNFYKVFIIFIFIIVALEIIIYCKSNSIQINSTNTSNFESTINSDTDLEKTKKANKEAKETNSSETIEEKKIFEENLIQTKKELEELIKKQENHNNFLKRN